MNKFITCIMATLLMIQISCQKRDTLPDTPIIDLGGETWVKGPLDEWLETAFLDPFNIQVKYKWDPYELNYMRNLVPVNEDKVKPVMEAVRQIWIKPYERVAGNAFMKIYVPKQFVLAGSAEYNTNGTIILGQAEGGRKIVLLGLNRFDTASRNEVQRMLHTIHHEFAHILHQTKLYPLEWKALNPEWYTATWYNNTDEEAHRQGLISAYAKASPDEDFVETVSFLLVFGQQYYDSVINKQDVPESSKQVLRRKREMVIDYFSNNFDIDFTSLQQETQAAITEYLQ